MKSKVNSVDSLLDVAYIILCSLIRRLWNDPINKGSSGIEAVNSAILVVPYVHDIVLFVNTLNFSSVPAWFPIRAL